MLASMRQGVSTVFAKIILGFLILSFAVWGVGDVAQHRGGNAEVAKVGSRTITAIEFERDLRREEETFRQRMGKQYNPQILRMLHVPEQLLGRTINEELYAMESARLGLIPSDETIAKSIRENQMFRGLTGFEAQKFKDFLARASLSENDYVKALKRDMGIKLLFATYTLPPTPYPYSVQLADAMMKETREVMLYNIPASALPTLPEPTKEQLTETYQVNAKAFIKPETREASVAIIEKGSEEEVTKAANTLEDLLAGGENFASAAKQIGAYVEKLPTITRNGESPNGSKAPLPKLENLVGNVFATEQGAESNVVSGGGGKMYLVHVDKVTPEAVPPLEEVQEAIEKLWRKEQADQAFVKLSTTIATSFDDADAREKAISSYGLYGSARTITHQTSGLPAELVNEVFSLGADKATGAYANDKGEYMIAVVKAIPAAPIGAYDAKSPNVEHLKAALSQEQLELFGKYLRTKYKVTVNEEALARIVEREQ